MDLKTKVILKYDNHQDYFEVSATRVMCYKISAISISNKVPGTVSPAEICFLFIIEKIINCN